MSHARGNKFEVIAPRSKFYQGPFGRICTNLPAWSPPPFNPNTDERLISQHFLDLANNEMVELLGKKPGEIAQDAQLIKELELEFGSNTPAGYTYFGQFIDHDITFDPASSLMRGNDPNGLLNHRTPRLDLDNIYGKGRAQSPYLFDQKDKDKLLVGEVAGTNLRDLPRNADGVALIGDMRNDENTMVSQLQLAFLLAHNKLVDRARMQNMPNPFEAARNTLRWLYQYVAWNDFVKRIANNDIHDCALKLLDGCGKMKSWQLGLKEVYNWRNQPFMPVEFSVAAYRFGHSMVRNSYQTNHPHRGAGKFAPIFANVGVGDPDDLRGFKPMTKENYIQWDWFLDMTSSAGEFPQKARKIDTKLANALAFLHEEPAVSSMNVLAFRNLLRGWRFGLPSGSALAQKYCLKPINIVPEHDALWFYILKEAESLPGANAGQMLGQLGSLIVCATFAGLLKGDPNSWVNIDPCWHPQNDPLLKENDNQDPGDWTLASIIRLSGLPVDAGDISNQT